ncbi:PREDICTED: uncharacterized protein LOC109178848 [Ipomoea nil]|uniref:uncharacterized protein LOC109178848 n=1 Tax=Ipomoea nil TaxID=35883 RepID=UPI000900BC20|nr:PREDICTED: uncharacterized protein LOC109178848 [Ipomoea nil]
MVNHLSSSLPTINPSSPLTNNHPSSENTAPNSPPQAPLEERNKELRIYRRRTFQNIEANMQSQDCSNTHLSLLDLENHEGKDSMTHELVPTAIDDLDLPIAHRKGVGTCTSHPIERYVAYGKLTPMYRAFVVSLDLVQIPTSIYEALRDPKWKVAVNEEINAFEKNGTWHLVELSQGKHAVGCEISNLKRFLTSEFKIKDLRFLKYFLGMEVARSKEGIVISQRKYILDLLNEIGMLGSKLAYTPMDPNLKTNRSGEPIPVERGSYQRLVGKLIYLSHTRPDIAFSVSVVSQHMHNPNEEHLEVVYRILRYLKMTPGLGLHFRKHDNRDLEVYTDSS